MRALLLNQAFYPDLVATAQYAGDFATSLARKGHEVSVICSAAGYDDGQIRFAPLKQWQGVSIKRIRCLNLGKTSRWRRALCFGSFLANCAWKMACCPRQDVIIALTSPPLIALLGAMYVRLRGGQLVYWVMDLNPDEAIAAGWLKAGSAVSRTIEWCSRFTFESAAQIVVLDRYMLARVIAKGVKSERITVIPPWSLDNVVKYDKEGCEQFRRNHGIEDSFVVMFSGNHSPCHPLGTLLEAAKNLKHHTDIVFCFIGGGSEQPKVREFAKLNGLKNVKCLPYQKVEDLGSSLSAADLHAVVMGDPFVGIIHPCKIYNILRLGLPVLYVGPARSHVCDLLSEFAQGRSHIAPHGGSDAVTQIILFEYSQRALRRPQPVLSDAFSQERLVEKLTRLACVRSEAAPLPKEMQTQSGETLRYP